MKIAFLFAGQGVQTVGMGGDFYDQYQSFKELYDQLKPELKEIILNGPQALLDDTANAQPALVAFCLGVARVLEEQGIVPEYGAGLSLGEYSALAHSQVLSLNDALEIVSKRGQIMSEALPIGSTGMAAVLSDNHRLVEEIITEIGSLDIANYNSPKQLVISGELSSLEKAIEKLREQKIRAIKLAVSGAFHSRYLTQASEELASLLEEYDFDIPKYPIVFNVNAKTETQGLKQLLTKQIKSPVLFQQSIEYMLEQGVDTFIEISPKPVLMNFVKVINSEVKVHLVNNIDSIRKVKEAIYE